MAAALASPPNSARAPGGASPAPGKACAGCGQSPADFITRHVCAGCGEPQPLAADENYFSVLGAPVRFGQDASALERAFYQVSRTLHPDRFTTASPTARARSLERMSFLNEAYRTLKDPARLRPYLLKLQGIRVSEGGNPPIELAEAWFELQDAVEGDPEHAAHSIAAFKAELDDLKARAEERACALEARADEAWAAGESPRTLLHEISDLLHEQSYLVSLKRDVERLQ